MKYIQVDISTTTAGVEPVGAMLLDLCIPGYSVRDPADFESFLRGGQGRWDYIEEDLMKLRDGKTVVTAYLADNDQGARTLEELGAALERLRGLDADREWGELALAVSGVQEEDWAHGWKKYFTPTKVGRKLVVCPSWERYEAKDGETVLSLDPGMAFGTGTHDSTRLCLLMLEEAQPPGKRVLDLGCGSGILSIAALLLGATEALGVDIEEAAVKTAAENAARNGVADRARYVLGNLAEGARGTFDIVLMNIVADVIIPFLPQVPDLLNKGGVFLASGIIDDRAQDVLAAMDAAGLSPHKNLESAGWVGICAGVR